MTTVTGMIILSIFCSIMGFVFGWHLRASFMNIADHPLKDRPLYLTRYQAECLSNIANGESVKIRWRAATPGREETEPAGLWVQHAIADPDLRGQYLAVSLDDDHVVATKRMRLHFGTQYSNYPRSPL